MALASVAVAAGCVARAPDPTPAFSEAAVPVQSVPFDPAPLDGIAWLPDGRIVFGHQSEANGATMGTHLWSIQPDGSAAGPLAIDPGVECTRTETLAPLTLASGELSYQLRCAPGAKGPFTYRTGLSTVDAAGRSTVLMPLTDLPFIPRQAAWSSDGTRGLIGGGSATCEGIALADRTGIHPWNLRVGAGPRRSISRISWRHRATARERATPAFRPGRATACTSPSSHRRLQSA